MKQEDEGLQEETLMVSNLKMLTLVLIFLFVCLHEVRFFLSDKIKKGGIIEKKPDNPYRATYDVAKKTFSFLLFTYGKANTFWKGRHQLVCRDIKKF